MTEQEYLDATNLARVRQALRILSDCTFLDDNEAYKICLASEALSALEGRLDKRICIKEEA